MFSRFFERRKLERAWKDLDGADVVDAGDVDDDDTRPATCADQTRILAEAPWLAEYEIHHRASPPTALPAARPHLRRGTSSRDCAAGCESAPEGAPAQPPLLRSFSSSRSHTSISRHASSRSAATSPAMEANARVRDPASERRRRRSDQQSEAAASDDAVQRQRRRERRARRERERERVSREQDVGATKPSVDVITRGETNGLGNAATDRSVRGVGRADSGADYGDFDATRGSSTSSRRGLLTEQTEQELKVELQQSAPHPIVDLESEIGRANGPRDNAAASTMINFAEARAEACREEVWHEIVTDSEMGTSNSGYKDSGRTSSGRVLSGRSGHSVRTRYRHRHRTDAQSHASEAETDHDATFDRKLLAASFDSLGTARGAFPPQPQDETLCFGSGRQKSTLSATDGTERTELHVGREDDEASREMEREEPPVADRAVSDFELTGLAGLDGGPLTPHSLTELQACLDRLAVAVEDEHSGGGGGNGTSASTQSAERVTQGADVSHDCRIVWSSLDRLAAAVEDERNGQWNGGNVSTESAESAERATQGAAMGCDRRIVRSSFNFNEDQVDRGAIVDSALGTLGALAQAESSPPHATHDIASTTSNVTVEETLMTSGEEKALRNRAREYELETQRLVAEAAAAEAAVVKSAAEEAAAAAAAAIAATESAAAEAAAAAAAAQAEHDALTMANQMSDGYCSLLQQQLDEQMAAISALRLREDKSRDMLLGTEQELVWEQ